MACAAIAGDFVSKAASARNCYLDSMRNACSRRFLLKSVDNPANAEILPFRNNFARVDPKGFHDGLDELPALGRRICPLRFLIIVDHLLEMFHGSVRVRGLKCGLQ